MAFPLSSVNLLGWRRHLEVFDTINTFCNSWDVNSFSLTPTIPVLLVTASGPWTFRGTVMPPISGMHHCWPSLQLLKMNPLDECATILCRWTILMLYVTLLESFVSPEFEQGPLAFLMVLYILQAVLGSSWYSPHLVLVWLQRMLLPCGKPPDRDQEDWDWMVLHSC